MGVNHSGRASGGDRGRQPGSGDEGVGQRRRKRRARSYDVDAALMSFYVHERGIQPYDLVRTVRTVPVGLMFVFMLARWSRGASQGHVARR